jgi:dephospho-CoA kinase
MTSIIICFAGRIGSGKTTLSNAVAECLNWPRASFGDYVRMEARRQGLNESRDVLQRIGAELVQDPDKLCYSMLGKVSWKPGENLVIDGIRHSRIIDSLLKLTNLSKVFLIFVETEEQSLRKRFSDKSTFGEDDLLRFEEHSTEAEVKEGLSDKADLIVDGTRLIKELVQEIVTWLQKKGEVDNITHYHMQ